MISTNKEQLERELLELLEQKEQDFLYNKVNYLFPETGPFRRELYPKHIAFMNAGAKFFQRAFITFWC